MRQNISNENNSNSGSKSKKTLALTCVLCTLVSLLVLLSALVSLAAFNSSSENTTELFGYKIFHCENDIEGTDIKKGSLIVIKNSDNDEFYTTEYLAENAVLVVDNLGLVLKENGFYIVLSAMIPLAFMFVVILLWEFKIIFARRAERPLSELEFTQLAEEEFICED